MDSDLHQNGQKQQMNSGLARYQSAPSSYFSNFMADVEAFVNPPRPLSPQTDRILEQLFSDTSTCHGDIQQNNNPFMKQEREEIEMIYQSPAAQILLPNQDSLGATIENSYGMMNTGRVNNVPQMKMDADIGNITAQGGSSSCNLIRQRSSPAGIFSQLNIDNDFLDTISEIVNKNVEQINPTFGELAGDDIGNYMTGFPVSSWDDSATLSDGFSMKRTRDNTAVDGGDGNDFSGSNALDSHRGELSGNRFPAAVLSHHLSLPKSSTEMMSAMENFMQFQDASTCKLRAKRGCATHPRSIAERVRRTRISERMKKLQELVPNMDKQTNTADMLDLAVDYIKDLKTQVKILMVNREQCSCSDI